MKTRTAGIAVALFLAAALIGCPSTNKLFEKGVGFYADVVLPEFEVYVRTDATAGRITQAAADALLKTAAELRKPGLTPEEADKAAGEVLPLYEKYVREDILLKDRSKEIRLRSSAGFRSLIKTAIDRGK